MFLPILLIVFGIMANRKGEFEVTRNLRVLGSTAPAAPIGGRRFLEQ
jgi:hypothetical protein